MLLLALLTPPPYPLEMQGWLVGEEIQTNLQPSDVSSTLLTLSINKRARDNLQPVGFNGPRQGAQKSTKASRRLRSLMDTTDSARAAFFRVPSTTQGRILRAPMSAKRALMAPLISNVYLTPSSLKY